MSRAPRARAAAAPPPEDTERLVRGNTELLGHEAAAAALEQAARSGRLPHAWLVTGAPGIGKATLCYRFARWLLAGAADRPVREGAAPLWLAPEEPAFARVAAGAHADLRTVRPVPGESGTRLAIRIEDVRSAIRFLTLTPAEGGWRVVVMEDAEATRAEQANALLKTLEEPPPRAVLLLTTAAPGRLLPTIRSRCRRLALDPLPPATMEQWLAGRLPEIGAEGRARLAAIAEGSPGRALALAESDALSIQAMVDEVLGSAAKPDRRRWHALADGIAAKRDGSAFVTLMALLRQAINEGVRQAARGGPPATWLGSRSLAEWSTLWDRLGALAAETEAVSLDRKQAMLTAFGWIAAKEPP